MGYEAHEYVPKLKAHCEMRRLRAEKRVRDASSNHWSNQKNVYNRDDLNDDNEYGYNNDNDTMHKNNKS
jgi:hypothetical protein